MNREHFLNECPPKIQQAHFKCIFSPKADAGLTKKLAHIRLNFQVLGRFPAASCSCLDENTIAFITSSGKILPVLKAVIAPKTANRLAFLFDKRKSIVLTYSIAQLFSTDNAAASSGDGNRASLWDKVIPGRGT